MIPHNQPQILARDRAAVDAVLGSGWISQGPAVRRLEAQFVSYYGGGGACALSSGTSALFVALKALGAGRGSVIAVPTYCCSAVLNAVFMTGGVPQAVDVRPDSFCLDAEGVRRQAPGAQFIIAVHTFGAPVELDDLRSLGAPIIEDCCQSLGGTRGRMPLGAAGAAAVFSFYATKIVTAGQGGLIWSAWPEVVANAHRYREFDGHEHYEPRFNLQMTDFQGALAGSQMQRLESIRARRGEIARAYAAALPKGLAVQAGLTVPERMVQRFVVVAPEREIRDALRSHMQRAGIGCIVPIDRFELLHRALQSDPGAYPVAERLADTTLSLPIHMCLSDEDVRTICEALSRFKP